MTTYNLEDVCNSAFKAVGAALLVGGVLLAPFVPSALYQLSWNHPDKNKLDNRPNVERVDKYESDKDNSNVKYKETSEEVK